MRFLHVADSHLGYSAYTKLAPNGLNQREVDVYNSFEKFVDYAIKLKPDFVLHAGDFFDTVRPTNRAIKFAIEQLLRFSEENIPIIIISGNHETPKLRETGSPLSFFEHLKNVKVVYRGKYEKIEVDNAIIHAIPHSYSTDALKENIEEAHVEDKYINIMMLHVGIFGIKEFSRGDFNEQIIPSGYLSPKFDYIALGHYHKATKVTENAFYSGSTERFSFKEAEEKKGFYLVEIDGGMKQEFIELPVREMIDLGSIDCTDKSPNDITREIIERMNNIEDKIVRLSLSNLNAAKYRSIDWKKIRKNGSSAIHFEINYSIKDIEHEVVARSKIGTLEEEWREYISQVPVGKDRKRIEELAVKYFSEVIK